MCIREREELHLRGFPVPRERLRLHAVLGGAELRHHQLRQHRLRHADSVPMHYDGGLDQRFILCK